VVLVLGFEEGSWWGWMGNEWVKVGLDEHGVDEGGVGKG
jgi:hypothetical protein